MHFTSSGSGSFTDDHTVYDIPGRKLPSSVCICDVNGIMRFIYRAVYDSDSPDTGSRCTVNSGQGASVQEAVVIRLLKEVFLKSILSIG